MANSIKIKVNGLTHGVSASLDTPLLYVLHNELHLHGPRFGRAAFLQRESRGGTNGE